MTLEEIISSLRDQITDRESLIPKDEPDSIFTHDAEALREAVKLLEILRGIAHKTVRGGLAQELRHYGLTNGSALGRHMGIMDEAADAIESLRKELEWKDKVIELAQRTEQQTQAERDAAVRDLEEIMFRGRLNIDTCRYCSTKDCYGRGGYRGCAPKWRDKDRQEEINYGKETEV